MTVADLVFLLNELKQDAEVEICTYVAGDDVVYLDGLSDDEGNTACQVRTPVTYVGVKSNSGTVFIS